MTDLQKIAILELTIEMMSIPSNYIKDTSFNQACTSNPPYTFSCALQLAHEKVMSTYDNRSEVMNSIRVIIYWNYFWRTGIHPIYSFSKHKKTTSAEIMHILNIALNNIKK